LRTNFTLWESFGSVPTFFFSIFFFLISPQYSERVNAHSHILGLGASRTPKWVFDSLSTSSALYLSETSLPPFNQHNSDFYSQMIKKSFYFCWLCFRSLLALFCCFYIILLYLSFLLYHFKNYYAILEKKTNI